MASLTIWTRLEPVTREGSMQRALQAQVRDPLWMLARQWQVGEFMGDDAGSPIEATVQSECIPLTSYSPRGAAATPLSPDLPLEARVERDPAPLGLRGSVRLGRLFERWLEEEGAGPGTAEAFRAAWPVRTDGPAGALPDVEAARLRRLAAGRVTDGEGLAAAGMAAALTSDVPPIPALAAGERAAATRALERLIGHRRGLLSEPEGDSAWVPEQLEHSFAIGAEEAGEAIGLHADEFRTARIDWHAFSRGAALGTPGGAERAVRRQTLMPNLVSFRGMPNDRWWEFEEGMTDFGRIDVAHVDLAKLIVMEFALTYGVDWFELPVRMPAGALGRVTHLVVTDTFGERTAIEPTRRAAPAGERQWRMFTLDGDEEDWLLLAPALRDSLDGREVDDVVLLRDETAAIGWAVEQRVRGELDGPVDAYEAYLERIRGLPEAVPEPPSPDDPPIAYRLATDVPDNWIPLVPVQNGPRSFVFRRGVMGGTGGRPAQSELLDPGSPYYVAEEAVPRSGVRITRRFRRARGRDGSTYVWLGRAASVGRGPGASGLMFDTIEERDRGPGV